MQNQLQEQFHNWKHSPITVKLFETLKAEREMMKEGLVHNQYDNEEEVKGRCNAIEILLGIQLSDLFEESIYE